MIELNNSLEILLDYGELNIVLYIQLLVVLHPKNSQKSYQEEMNHLLIGFAMIANKDMER